MRFLNLNVVVAPRYQALQSLAARFVIGMGAASVFIGGIALIEKKPCHWSALYLMGSGIAGIFHGMSTSELSKANEITRKHLLESAFFLVANLTWNIAIFVPSFTSESACLIDQASLVLWTLFALSLKDLHSLVKRALDLDHNAALELRRMQQADPEQQRQQADMDASVALLP